jgi:transposase
MSSLEATPVTLTIEERAELEGLARSTKAEHRTRLKARIVLMAAEGAATRTIGRALGCTTGTASKWRVRYAKDRLAGFSETGNRGAKAKYGIDAGRRILALLDTAPPEGCANWTGPLIAKALGDVHVQQIWRFLRAHKIDLSGRKSWCVSNDPEFAAKAAEIVGLYMAPPDNAVVLAVDEKPSIQALERAQGYLKLPNGRAMTGQSHDYKRHGTTTLFAALDVGSGEVVGRHYKRRRRVEFRSAKSTLSSTICPLTSPPATCGSSATRTSISTTRRPTPPGSVRSKSGSRSSPPGRSTAPPSEASKNWWRTSTLSSNATITPLAPSSGPNPRSIKNASAHVSPTNDSGY